MNAMPSQEERSVMNLSLAVAVLLLVIKVVAAILTGSASVTSDALESITHVAAVAFAAWALRYSYKPSDEDHHYGHDKITYVSATIEGVTIILAALYIFYHSIRQFVYGVEIQSLDIGIGLIALAAIINLILGLILLHVARKKNSELLHANGQHVLTDVWTSVGVVLALVLVKFTGWLWWDPLLATLAAAKLLYTAQRIIKGSMAGLLDEVDPEEERKLRKVLDEECESRKLSYHNLRIRHSGRKYWIEMHLVVPDNISVHDAHEIATQVESRAAKVFGSESRVISHIEPFSAEHEVKKWEER